MKKLLALLVVAGFATAASAGPIVTLVSQSDPATGLSAYVLHAEAAGGESDVNAWTLNATVAHQIYNSSDEITPQITTTGDAWPAEASTYDSHALFVAADYVSPGSGGILEGNDESDPASVAPVIFGGYKTLKTGVGVAKQEGAALTPAAAGQSLDIYLWVVPSGVEATLSGEIASPGVAPAAFEFTVPEPATMSLLALGGIALLRRRR